MYSAAGYDIVKDSSFTRNFAGAFVSMTVPLPQRLALYINFIRHDKNGASLENHGRWKTPMKCQELQRVIAPWQNPS